MYRLEPNGKLLKTLQAAGIGGLSLEVIETKAGRVMRLGPVIPQGPTCILTFSTPACLGFKYFDKKDLTPEFVPVSKKPPNR